MKDADTSREGNFHIVKIGISNEYNLIIGELYHEKIYKYDKYLHCSNEVLWLNCFYYINQEIEAENEDSTILALDDLLFNFCIKTYVAQ